MNLYEYYSNPEELNGYKEILCNNPKLAFAFTLRYGPTPELESIIATKSKLAFEYAMYILEGPFPMGEEAISKIAVASYRYAVTILKDRFELAEPTILKSGYKNLYLRFLKNKGIEI